jgi:hypothetical protein
MTGVSRPTIIGWRRADRGVASTGERR